MLNLHNMLIWRILILNIFVQTLLFAQNNTKFLEYEIYENGKKLENTVIKLYSNNQIAKIINPTTTDLFSINYKDQFVYKTAILQNKTYTVPTHFDSLPKPEITNIKDTILGYICTKYNYTYFSNKVEVWSTTASPFKGSPSSTFVVPNGLVLKYVVNGNRTVIVKSISDSTEKLELDINKEDIVDNPTFLSLQINSRFLTIPIFKNEQINFRNNSTGTNYFDSVSQVFHYSKGNIILKKVNLPKGNGYYFLNLKSWSNGDAYDRVGSVFTIPSSGKSMLDAFRLGVDSIPYFLDNHQEKYQGVVSKENYITTTELMRFFTPFGVGYFNNLRKIKGYNWADSVIYRQEVTALIPEENEMWIGVYIGNYDNGGHKVSLDLQFYPDNELPSKINWTYPLFNTVNIMEAMNQNYGKMFLNDTLEVDFNILDTIADVELLYTTTGHGGWENGDEFVPKSNQIWIDNSLVFHHTPWRTDCGTYRLNNPASGNFTNGLSSSDLSRSNWCPGTITPPYRIPLKGLKIGKHSIKIVIDQGKNEGTSFSHWCVSGVLVGDKK